MWTLPLWFLPFSLNIFSFVNHKTVTDSWGLFFALSSLPCYKHKTLTAAWMSYSGFLVGGAEWFLTKWIAASELKGGVFSCWHTALSFNTNSDCTDRARASLERCMFQGFGWSPESSAVALFPNKATWEGRVLQFQESGDSPGLRPEEPSGGFF